MTYLKLSILSFSLAALMLGCSKNDNDNDPLVPEIESIMIEGTNAIHSIAISSDNLQLVGRINYTNGASSTTYNELDWESNDTSVILVHNGLLAAVSNHGTVNISASYRNKISTTTDYKISIIPLKDVNITSIDAPTVDINYSTAHPYAVLSTPGTYQLQSNGTFDDNKTIEKISSNISWTSSNETIASISPSGSLIVYEINGTIDINISVYGDSNSSLELNVTTQP